LNDLGNYKKWGLHDQNLTMLTIRNDGILEKWNNGLEAVCAILNKNDINPFKPILPTFQYSSIPTLSWLKSE